MCKPNLPKKNWMRILLFRKKSGLGFWFTIFFSGTGSGPGAAYVDYPDYGGGYGAPVSYKGPAVSNSYGSPAVSSGYGSPAGSSGYGSLSGRSGYDNLDYQQKVKRSTIEDLDNIAQVQLMLQLGKVTPLMDISHKLGNNHIYIRF